jgi:pilus assembly protein CpaF
MEASMVEVKKADLVESIKKQVRDRINLNDDLNDKELTNVITDITFNLSKEHYLKIAEKQELIYIVFNALRRLDILQPLLEDPSVTEIMINGPQNIYIEKQGSIFKLDKSFDSKEKLEDVIQSIVARVNRAVNEANPIADARLLDGSRVSVVLPPAALNGPILNIRKFNKDPITIENLIQWESISEEAANMLKKLVRAKYNIFICGGTGSGKTTFLNALAYFIPINERIVTIEDSAELQVLSLENVVRMETRNINTEGKGEITIRDLIKASLRMRPDRIIVGEVRGAEALDMLQAMNTGHDGSLSTGHSNSTKDMLSRLETMVLSGVLMPVEAIRQQIVSAIDIVIHLSRLRDKTRRVLEIVELVDYKNGEIQVNPLYMFCEEGAQEDKKVIGSLKRTSNQLSRIHKLKMAGLSEE